MQSSPAHSSTQAFLLRPIDGAWLATFRVWFGLAMSVSMVRFAVHDWIEPLFVRPALQFHYWGLGWLAPLPRAQMHVLFWVLAALALLMALGVLYRASSLLFALGLTYVHMLDVTIYLNHYYLATLLAFLLGVSPAHRQRPVAAAWLYLFRFQVAVVYVFAGLAKLQSDWLVHAQPVRIWLGAHTDLPLLGPTFTWEGVPLLMSWFGFLFDTTIVLWLSIARTRPYAYAVLVVFHVLTRVLFPIGMFPVIMTGAALVFFPPDWPRRWLGRFGEAVTQPPKPRRWHTAALALGALYCVVQVALPMRYLAYGGNVLWHEQGMRFSWRVMVRAKGGGTSFVVRNPQTGASWQVQPSAYLTPLQESEMVAQPDLIVQLAHHIRDDFARRGRGPVEVHAESFATLNGRRAQRLIDPEVDLAAVEDGLAPAPWILPAPDAPPPHTRPVL